MKGRHQAVQRAAALTAVTLLIPVAAHADQITSLELPTEIDTRNFPGLPSGEGRNFTIQDSYDGANETNRSQSGQHATDGNNSLHVQDVDGGFSVAWQYNVSNFDDPGNPNVQSGTQYYADMIASTKLMIDITTPAGGPAWSGGYAGLNYAFGSANYPSGLYVTSYNIADGGNQYQYTAGNASQTGPVTQTYIWDFGGQFNNVGIPRWDGHNNYMILHWHHNSEAGFESNYFMDNLRWVNVDTAANPTWKGA